MIIAALVVSAGAGSAAGEARWSLGVDKAMGQPVARLAEGKGAAVREVSLGPARSQTPVSAEERVDPDVRRFAERRNLRLLRVKVRDVEAAPLEGGRYLLLQEQTVIGPALPVDAKGLPAVGLRPEWVAEPEDNTITATLLDARGRTVWSRAYGPLRGRYPLLSVEPPVRPESVQVSTAPAEVGPSTGTAQVVISSGTAEPAPAAP